MIKNVKKAGKDTSRKGYMLLLVVTVAVVLPLLWQMFVHFI